MRAARLVACIGISAGLTGFGAAAWAQPPSAARGAPAAKAAEQTQVRFQISVMEGVLERAVENAVRTLNRQIQPMTPELFIWGPAAQARGFRLEGYGVFFDVAVPMLRQSLVSAFQIMGPPEGALKMIRDHFRTISDPRQRDQLDQALRQIEIQLRPAGVFASSAAATPEAAAAQATMMDPSTAYTNAVTAGLIDAMLDYSRPLQIGPDEWLTVAARDYEGQRGLAPDEPYDVVTVILRVRGADLAAYAAGKLTKEEARKKVDVKEF